MNFCYYVVYDENQLPTNIVICLPNEPISYSGRCAASKFIEDLIPLRNLTGDLVNVNIAMIPLIKNNLDCTMPVIVNYVIILSSL
jgi:hypothetical protein